MGTIYIDNNKVSFKPSQKPGNTNDGSSLCYYDQRIHWCNELCNANPFNDDSDHSKIVHTSCNCIEKPVERSNI